jgi:hypothetical protein
MIFPCSIIAEHIAFETLTLTIEYDFDIYRFERVNMDEQISDDVIARNQTFDPTPLTLEQDVGIAPFRLAYI